MAGNTKISRERITKAYFIAAELVAEYGPEYLPAFERLGHEVDALAAEEELLEKAKAVVAAGSLDMKGERNGHS